MLRGVKSTCTHNYSDRAVNTSASDAHDNDASDATSNGGANLTLVFLCVVEARVRWKGAHVDWWHEPSDSEHSQDVLQACSQRRTKADRIRVLWFLIALHCLVYPLPCENLSWWWCFWRILRLRKAPRTLKMRAWYKRGWSSEIFRASLDVK
jgi:hypothetical protein